MNITNDWVFPVDDVIWSFDQKMDKRLVLNYYPYYYDVIKKCNVQSVLEIGVRAGYSMFSMLSANPGMKYVGIDIDSNTHGGTKSAIHHARQLIKEHFSEGNARIIVQNSQKLDELDYVYDLMHIDGDHSTKGCLHDLELAKKYAKYAFVDDYKYLKTVKIAVDIFLEDNPDYEYWMIDSFRGHVLIKFTNKD